MSELPWEIYFEIGMNTSYPSVCALRDKPERRIAARTNIFLNKLIMTKFDCKYRAIWLYLRI